MTKRVVVLVDGFNVYHSLIEARRNLGGKCVKWLNVGSLAQSFMQHVPGKADVSKVYYFSALATHLAHSKPGVVGRHQAYIRALKHSGAEIVLGKFKDKNVRCPSCRNRFVAHEEKETDVAISMKLLEVLQRDQADTVMVISGDSDLVPAVKTALGLFPDREVACAFPFRRFSRELSAVASVHFKIGAKQYLRHQFPDVLEIQGRELPKPASW